MGKKMASQKTPDHEKTKTDEIKTDKTKTDGKKQKENDRIELTALDLRVILGPEWDTFNPAFTQWYL